jgi:metal-responsive CopG/Arc/MetJ family transcriptional regulator
MEITMRTIVDLPEEQIEALKVLGDQYNTSRTELVRRAVAEYLARRSVRADDAAFGIWQDRGEDGLAYQERMRREWEP